MIPYKGSPLSLLSFSFFLSVSLRVSLSPSLSLCVIRVRMLAGLWNQAFHGCVGIRKALKAVSKRDGRGGGHCRSSLRRSVQPVNRPGRLESVFFPKKTCGPCDPVRDPCPNPATGGHPALRTELVGTRYRLPSNEETDCSLLFTVNALALSLCSCCLTRMGPRQRSMEERRKVRGKTHRNCMQFQPPLHPGLNMFFVACLCT
jgi:hypothetical protein